MALKCAVLSCFSRVCLFTTPWTVVHQPPLSMGFSRQEYLGGLSFPPPGYFPGLESESTSLVSPALAGRFFTTEPPGKPLDHQGSPFIKVPIGVFPIYSVVLPYGAFIQDTLLPLIHTSLKISNLQFFPLRFFISSIKLAFHAVTFEI